MISDGYKDRLFCMLFGSEEYKENILSLYNALCGTEHTDVNDIKIYTIWDVIYIQMKNDISLLLDSFLYLWEQESIFNPNMPLKGLMCFGEMYNRYITENKRTIDGETLVKLPTPQYTVLYNGTEERPSFVRLRLSDAFMNSDNSGDFEWTADMINLNEGKNDDLLDNCQPLKDYMTLINQIRMNSKTMEFEEAVDVAVNYCIEHDILKEFLLKYGAEVKDVCITAYHGESFLDGIREEEREQGRAEGRAEGHAEGDMKRLIKQTCKKMRMSLSPEEIADDLAEDDVALIQKIMDAAQEFAPEYDIDAIYKKIAK